MKLHKLLCFLTIILVGTQQLSAQRGVKIGDNANTINAGSLLELETSTGDQGFLPPRLQLNNLNTWTPLAGTAAAGMFVYNNVASAGIPEGFYYWDGTQWVQITGAQDAEWLDDNIGGVDLIYARQANASGNDVVITDAGQVGIGTTNPAFQFEMHGAAPNMNLYRYDNSTTGAVFRVQKARGTQVAPLATSSGDDLGGIYFGGHDGTNWLFNTAYISSTAEDNFSATTQGSNLRFYTTNVGGSANSEKMRISANGNVGIGVTAPIHPLHVNGVGYMSSGGRFGNTSTFGATNGTGAGAISWTLSNFRLIGDTGLGLRLDANNNNSANPGHLIINTAGDLSYGNYPNTRNDAATTAVENLLYTDVSGNMLSAPLSAIVDSTKDADWYEVGTTDVPNDINDFIYTQGRVAIGTTTANADLNVGGSQTISFIGTAPSSSLSSPGNLIINANGGAANITPRAEEFRFNGFDAGTLSTVNIRGVDAGHTALTLGLNTSQTRNVMQITDDANLPVTVFDNEGFLGIGSNATNPTGELDIDHDYTAAGHDIVNITTISNSQAFRIETGSTADVLNYHFGNSFFIRRPGGGPATINASGANLPIHNDLPLVISNSDPNKGLIGLNALNGRPGVIGAYNTAHSTLEIGNPISGGTFPFPQATIFQNSNSVIINSEAPASNNNPISFQLNTPLDANTIYVPKATGNIGMGTNNPTTKLHVTSATDPLRLDGLVVDNAMDTVLTTDATGVVHKTPVDQLTSIKDHDWYQVGTSSAPTNINSNIYRQGNVGIGLTSPGSPLHVQSAADAITNFQTSDDSWLYTQWLQSNGTRRVWMGLSNDLSEFHINGENGTDELIFDDVRVGIETAAPVSMLSFGRSYDNGLRPKIAVYENTVAGAGDFFYGMGLYDPDGVASNGDEGLSLFGGTEALAPKVLGTDVGQDPHVFIQRNTGNVGMGTTNPFSTLHVRNTDVYSADNAAVDNSSIVLYGSVSNAVGDHFGGITWASSSSRKRAGISSVMENTDADHLGLAFWTQGTDGPGPMAESMRINRAGNVGIGTTAPSERLHVIGNILASGTITPSDRRFKTNINTLTGALPKLMQLRGVTYDMNEEHKDKGLGEGTQIGVIAQEVEEVYPELVITNKETGYKGVDYSKFTPVLIEAVKEQQTEIDELEAKLAQQTKELEALKKQNSVLQSNLEDMNTMKAELEEIKSLLRSTSHNK